MNKNWHQRNKLLQGSSEEKRMKWHIAHHKNCGCRPIPKTLLAKMKANELPVKK